MDGFPHQTVTRVAWCRTCGWVNLFTLAITDLGETCHACRTPL